MCKGGENRVLSNVELILPWNVVEACYSLERNDSTNFFATNENEGTTSQISLCKLDDHSVKIQVTVTSFDPDAAEDEEQEPSTSTPRTTRSSRPSPKEEHLKSREEESQRETEEPTPKKKGKGRPKKGGKGDTPRIQEPEPIPEEREPVPEPTPRQTLRSRGKKGRGGKEPAMPVLENMEEEDRLLGPEDIDLELIYKYGPLMRAYEEQKRKERNTWERLQEQMKKIKEGRESMVIVIKGEDEELLEQPGIEKAVHATEQELVHVIQPLDEEPPILEQGQRVDEYSQGLGDDPDQVIYMHKTVNDEADYIDDGQKRKFFKRRREVATRVGKDTTAKNQPAWKDTTPTGKRIKIEKMSSGPNINCRFCPRMFKDHCYLFRHVKSYHADHPKGNDYLEEIKPMMKVQCPICEKTISNIGNINNHMKQCHPEGDISVQCDMCEKWYKTPASLKQHIRQRHNDAIRKLDCPQCDLKFAERRALKDHINCVHETTQVFTCSKCWKVFLTKSRLRRHMYIHGEHRHICKQCGKGFHIKDNMNKHVRIVHEKNDGKMWRCSYCSKEFLVKGNLTQHIRGIHLKQFPFTCSKCQQGFRRMKDMMIHMEKCTADGEGEPDNLEMFSSPITPSRKGKGGGRKKGSGGTPQVGRRRLLDGAGDHEDDEEDFDEDEEDLDEEFDDEYEEGDEDSLEITGNESLDVSKYAINQEDEEEDDDDDDEESINGPHQEIVLTTNGAGDGAMEFQLEQDGMVIPIEVVIDQNETGGDGTGLEPGEVVAEGS